jgi:hypothetical protein
MLKPIETIYRGYRFRSRLEARWAVFFSRAGVAYQYEVEGFHLPSGDYLPDFYCRDISQDRLPTFVEVKPLPCPYDWIDPRLPYPLPLEVQLGCELVEHMPGINFVVVYGDPLNILDEDSGAVTVWTGGEVECGIGPLDYIANLYRAADAARAARFEHGEQP